MRQPGQLPGWVDYGLLPFINVCAAFLVSGLVVLAIGENPIEAVEILLWGSLGFGEGIGFTLFYATNFIFTGLAVAVAVHCGLFNIGGEGQAYFAGLGVGLVCLWLDAFPVWLTFPVAIAAAMAFGGFWALIPGWLQAKRGSHVVITTIMFNFIASAVMVYMLVDVLSPKGSMQPETRTFEAGGHLPLARDWVGFIDVGQAPLNISFLLALVAAAAVYVLIWRTRLGYEIRSVGTNSDAAVYAGMVPARLIVITMVISGALAGMMALNEVMGSQNRLVLEFTSGYGFVGIAVALMGRAHPIGVILAAILFGMLYQGGAELAFEKPDITRDMIIVIQGLVILFAGALENMFRPALLRLFAPSTPAVAATGRA